MPVRAASSSEQASSNTRLVSMSRTGRFVAIRQANGINIVDALGTSPRVFLKLDDLVDFACVGKSLWAIAGEQLHAYSLDSGKEQAWSPHPLPGAGQLAASIGETASMAVVTGVLRHLVIAVRDSVTVEDISAEAPVDLCARPLASRRLLLGGDGHLIIRDLGKGDVVRAVVPNNGSVRDGSSVLGGRAVAVFARGAIADSFVVFRPSGGMIHNVKLAKSERCAFAEVRGLALAQTGDQIAAVDLRYGRVIRNVDAPLAVADMVIDANGRNLVLAGFDSNGGLDVRHFAYTELFGARSRAAPMTAPERRRDDGRRSEVNIATEVEEAEETPTDASAEAASITDIDEDQSDAEQEQDVEIPDLPLEALGRIIPPPQVPTPEGVAPYASEQQHLEGLLDVIVARTARAIADAWDSGRLSLPANDTRPYEQEVNALVGRRMFGAREELALADGHVARLSTDVGLRGQASIAAGQRLPFIELAREFSLSTMAAQVLLVVAAPALRGEVARLYGVLANDEHRPICDRHLVQMILAGDDRAMRQQVARELSNDSVLVTYGLVRIAPAPHDQYLFAPLTVDPVLLGRLRGAPSAGAGAGAVAMVRSQGPDLERLAVPETLKRDLVLALARPPHGDTAIRLAIRGRHGSGRRSLLTALARRAERSVVVIDAERLPRMGRGFADRLRTELRRAGLRGGVPCVSGMEFFDSSDAEAVEHVREVFRSHPGPITFRTSPEYKLPIDPGYLSFTLPPLSETERLDFWNEALERAGMEAEDIEGLASRFRIGPGVIEDVIAQAKIRQSVDDTADSDATDLLVKTARQHISSRLGNVATHITRLARWEQVALPEDVIDSLREFLGRVKHRRTVYEAWGYYRRMSTSRGLTALFHGPPGTGKSMVAGLIARELGLDLYRVDLAQITSKWIGETEKNLGDVFDAAEDGQAVILFDEADSLFAKRTEVKSSVDRYANLEVNYLLQRLDSFDGVAILTTNLEGSLDTAFKRRLSLRLGFPFHDEEMRVRLWATHLPPEVPTKGEFDFADLAKRFPMSGGYIRNSALRAAFLAAQEGVPLDQEHLERAIHLEYREMGKLTPGGKME